MEHAFFGLLYVFVVGVCGCALSCTAGTYSSILTRFYVAGSQGFVVPILKGETGGVEMVHAFLSQPLGGRPR